MIPARRTRSSEVLHPVVHPVVDWVVQPVVLEPVNTGGSPDVAPTLPALEPTRRTRSFDMEMTSFDPDLVSQWPESGKDLGRSTLMPCARPPPSSRSIAAKLDAERRALPTEVALFASKAAVPADVSRLTRSRSVGLLPPLRRQETPLYGATPFYLHMIERQRGDAVLPTHD